MILTWEGITEHLQPPASLLQFVVGLTCLWSTVMLFSVELCPKSERGFGGWEQETMSRSMWQPAVRTFPLLVFSSPSKCYSHPGWTPPSTLPTVCLPWKQHCTVLTYSPSCTCIMPIIWYALKKEDEWKTAFNTPTGHSYIYSNAFWSNKCSCFRDFLNKSSSDDHCCIRSLPIGAMCLVVYQGLASEGQVLWIESSFCWPISCRKKIITHNLDHFTWQNWWSWVKVVDLKPFCN